MTDSETARDETTPAEHPPGDYAIVEILGHQTFIGRIESVQRFGTEMLQVEPIFRGQLLAPILQGGASIYRLTPCTAETAFERAPSRGYHLPSSLRATLPADLLADPEPPRPCLTVRDDFADDDSDDYDDIPL